MIYEYTSTPYYRSTFLHVNRYAWYRCAPLSVATLVGGLVRVHVFHRAIPILPQNALRRDYNGKSIEIIEGHYLEVVVLLYML